MKAYTRDVHKAKHVKELFPSSDKKDKGALDIIHLDMCGLMSATSLRGYVYYA
jgi:hypothetical protein